MMRVLDGWNLDKISEYVDVKPTSSMTLVFALLLNAD